MNRLIWGFFILWVERIFQVCIVEKLYDAAGKGNDSFAMANMNVGNRQGETHKIQHLGEALPP